MFRGGQGFLDVKNGRSSGTEVFFRVQRLVEFRGGEIFSGISNWWSLGVVRVFKVHR